MCVSMAPADFFATTLYAGRLRHPQHGLVHVVGYQNSARNLAEGPNAMVLHFPARALGRGNFVPVGGAEHVLADMVRALPPLPVSPGAAMDWMDAGGAPPVEVFDHDVYTVLVAEDATLIPAALDRVPPKRRPRLDPGLLRFYTERYPGHVFAVCCFDNAERRQAKPLLVWYAPHDPDLLAAPALDSHTGGAPDPAARVRTDHTVLFGTDEAAPGWGSPVHYRDTLGPGLAPFLPRAVVGARFHGWMPNGDFAIPHADLLAGDLRAVRRVGPPA
ncbi:hypothetical protein LG943_07690 [Streptomonospora sp. S1-112]|uniref:Uncharacterized protein n=1 Tax=Streptomonospora mangrovi TaxID=2883123 RepID=A0A9X3SDT6_9ACTN|nr:hypothetical protein [Streptomonospora mangrovi]MDA0564207.1 hypothetical protein [Streptomonospora mangrovi]